MGACSLAREPEMDWMDGTDPIDESAPLVHAVHQVQFVHSAFLRSSPCKMFQHFADRCLCQVRRDRPHQAFTYFGTNFPQNALLDFRSCRESPIFGLLSLNDLFNLFRDQFRKAPFVFLFGVEILRWRHLSAWAGPRGYGETPCLICYFVHEAPVRFQKIYFFHKIKLRPTSWSLHQAIGFEMPQICGDDNRAHTKVSCARGENGASLATV